MSVAERPDTGAFTGAKPAMPRQRRHAEPIKWVCSPGPQLIPRGAVTVILHQLARLSFVEDQLASSSPTLSS
jgi:hypothetical protein